MSYIVNPLKSIQRSSVLVDTVSGIVGPITPVILANSVALPLGNTNVGGSGSITTRTELTSTNSVTIYGTISATPTQVNFQVLEFFSAFIHRVQRDTITILAANTTGTKAITAVNLTKSILFHLGQNGGTLVRNVLTRLDFTSNVLITATRDQAGGDLTVGFAIVEFK